MCVSPAKVIRLNVSRGFIASRANFMVSFAFSIGKPDMDPEVSSTKTSSFGVMSSTFVFSGGCRIRVKKPPRFLRCVSIASSSLPARYVVSKHKVLIWNHRQVL